MYIHNTHAYCVYTQHTCVLCIHPTRLVSGSLTTIGFPLCIKNGSPDFLFVSCPVLQFPEDYQKWLSRFFFFNFWFQVSRVSRRLKKWLSRFVFQFLVSGVPASRRLNTKKAVYRRLSVAAAVATDLFLRSYGCQRWKC